MAADHAAATSYWQMYVHKKTDVDEGKVKTTEPNHFCEPEGKFVRTEDWWLMAQRIFKRVL